MSEIFDTTRCELGEGPLWHPERKQLLWCDINKYQVLLREGDDTRAIQFDEHVSAAGWVDESSILLASESRLLLLNLDSEKREDVEGLEPDNPETRSNDGRADPWGGFWIGTMSKTHEAKAGKIYRYYRGELRVLYPGISIPNAMCFSPDRKFAYFADTVDKRIMRQALDADRGWPDGEPEVFVDLTSEGLLPDGAVVDTAGHVWCAMFNSGKVMAFSKDGEVVEEIAIDAPQTTCPAFGGSDLSTLFCTTAARSMPKDDGIAHGAVFAVHEVAHGQTEHRVKL